MKIITFFWYPSSSVADVRFQTQHGIIYQLVLALIKHDYFCTIMDFRKDFVSSGTQAVDSDYESPADTSGLIVSQVRIHKALFLKTNRWNTNFNHFSIALSTLIFFCQNNLLTRAFICPSKLYIKQIPNHSFEIQVWFYQFKCNYYIKQTKDSDKLCED